MTAKKLLILFVLTLTGVACDYKRDETVMTGDTLVARGKVLYQSCTYCHKEDGSGLAKIGAPAIAGLESWYVEAQLYKFRDGMRGYHHDDIEGLRMRPMAMYLKTENDFKAVSAYVANMPSKNAPESIEGGNAEKGKTYYATCIACHGADAKGNKQVNAPALNHANDWYLVNQLKKFKHGMRGTNPKDATGMTMRPMSMTLPDEQAMKDVVAYIKSLK